MIELIIGIIGCVFLYWLGGILYEHDYPFKVIQRELMHMESEEE
tara:strand:- start:277 stop:408 length:132 start_codon:yes stop_codon:yes gene_type:complete